MLSFRLNYLSKIDFICKMSIKKERLRFSTVDDLCLLRQVICLNPYNDANQWENIQNTLSSTSNKNFSIRSVKEHVEYLLKIWKKEDRANLKK